MTTPIILATMLAFTVGASGQAPQTNVPTTTNPSLAGDGVKVGIAKTDGVSFSGGEAFVTRNGVTEKLTKELLLPSGVKVSPDGTVTLADQTQANLRSTQVLTFEGKVMEIPLDPNVNPGDRNAPPSATSMTKSKNDNQATTRDGATSSARSMPSDRQNGGGGTIFAGSDGVPFTGTLNPNGTITMADGSTIAADRNLRAVTVGPDGTTTTIGTVNADGTITQPNGTRTTPNSNAQMNNSPATSSNQQTNPVNPQAPANSSSGSNSPANTGTTNNGNSNPGTPNAGGNQTNNGVAAGQSNGASGTSGQNTNKAGTRGTNGATGGAVSGGGASGAGGASGGGAGGASR